MGRCLNYSIEKDGAFTDKEKAIIHEHSVKYNSGEYENIWSCENFYLTPYNYYPNWDKKSDWSVVEKRYNELLITGLKEVEVIKKLHKEKLIKYHYDCKSKIGGFTKVQGNELNALLIYYILVELSKKLPNTLIKLSDEGDFLYCPVEIRRGKVCPRLGEVKEDIDRLIAQSVLSNCFEGNILNKIEIPEGFNEYTKRDLNLENGYGDMLKYVNKELKNIHTVIEIVKPQMKDVIPAIFNISNRFFEPRLLHRPVDPEDFKDYTMNPGTLMAGFYGEYWNLEPDKDAELESYKTAAFVQNAVGDSATIQILGTHGESNSI